MGSSGDRHKPKQRQWMDFACTALQRYAIQKPKQIRLMMRFLLRRWLSCDRFLYPVAPASCALRLAMRESPEVLVSADSLGSRARIDQHCRMSKSAPTS